MEEKPGYTRVTEILSAFSGLNNVPKDILENAGRRGTKVHDICEAIVSGLGEWGVDDEVSGYIQSFKQWWKPDTKVLSIEERFYDDQLKITGKVDLIIESPDGAIIIDYKTSYKPSKTWPIQGSAYAYLARKAGYPIKGIQFVHLNKHGMKPDVYDYPEQFEIFQQCLNLHNYFFKRKNGSKRS